MSSPFISPSRRLILGGLVAAPAVLAFGRAQAGGDLFTLGVASGDPWPDGFVIWTRLAANPVAPDGLGGLDGPIPVRWEVGADPQFRRILAAGDAIAEPRNGHAVHVEVAGLSPDRPAWYRFVAQGQQSPVGHARTAPAPGAEVARLKLAIASCSNWEMGYFSAYRHMAQEQADLTLFLGDYIYEYSRGPERAAEVVRPYGLEEATALAGYRNRYALHRTDPDLQALHAANACLAVWDDHETHDDYSGVWTKTPGVAPADFLRRRAAAYQAFAEHMPLRRANRFDPLGMTLHRRVRWGRLAEFHMLDGRQHRSRQPCSTGENGGKGQIVTDATCTDRLDPSRTFLGFDQERWLYDGLARADARWNLLGQNLVMAGLRFGAGGPGEIRYWTDTWDGFPAARDRLTAALAGLRPSNPVVFSGDYHSFWTNDVKADAADPSSPTLATEFVGAAITSTGPSHEGLSSQLPGNPHIKFFDSRVQGYMTAEVTPDRMITRYQAISDRRDPAASVSTLRTWAVESGQAGAVEA